MKPEIFSPKPDSLLPKPASLPTLLVFSVQHQLPLILLSSSLFHTECIIMSFLVLSPLYLLDPSTLFPSPQPPYFPIISILDIYNVSLTGLSAMSKLFSTVVTTTLVTAVVPHLRNYWIYLDIHYSLRAVWVYLYSAPH